MATLLKYLNHARTIVEVPGFVDTHSHADISLLRGRSVKAAQGITTEIVGNCGLSVAPVGAKQFAAWRRRYESIFGPANGYRGGELETLLAAHRGRSVRIFSLIGTAALRYAVMGDSPRAASPAAVGAMAGLLEVCFAQGAVGLSYGPYLPSGFMSHEELRALVRVCSAYDKVFTTHLPDEGTRLIESIDWAIDLARDTDVRLHISHLKANGLKNIHKIGLALKRIERAARSIEISFDAYPYAAGATTLMAVAPPEFMRAGEAALRARLKRDCAFVHRVARRMMLAGREWESLFLRAGPDGMRPYNMGGAYRKFNGRTLGEIGREMKLDPEVAALKILADQGGRVGMTMFTQSQDVVDRVICHPLCVIGTDALPEPFPHPRARQTMLKVIERYVLEQKRLTLEQAVRKMTVQSERIFRIPPGRARLKLDLAQIKTDGSFTDPRDPAGCNVMRHE